MSNMPNCITSFLLEVVISSPWPQPQTNTLRLKPLACCPLVREMLVATKGCTHISQLFFGRCMYTGNKIAFRLRSGNITQNTGCIGESYGRKKGPESHRQTRRQPGAH